MIELRDQIEPNLYVSRSLGEREYDPGGEGSGSLDAGWSKAGGGEDDDERGVCAGCDCCRSLRVAVLCCRSLGSGDGEGIGAEEVDPSVNVRWGEEWECVSGGGRQEEEREWEPS